MKRLAYPSLCIFLLIASCSTAPSNAEIQTAIAETQAAAPTDTLFPTETTIPLENIDLESILIHEGDLPAGYSEAQVRSAQGRRREPELDKSINSIFQQFSLQGEAAGGVSVYLFKTSADCDAAFNVIVEGLEEAEVIDHVGENAVKWSVFLPLIGGSTIEGSMVVFIRCDSLIIIEMKRAGDVSGAIAYGQRLDQRLQEVICR
jgi:hypothetical protein